MTQKNFEKLYDAQQWTCVPKLFFIYVSELYIYFVIPNICYGNTFIKKSQMSSI